MFLRLKLLLGGAAECHQLQQRVKHQLTSPIPYNDKR